MAKKYIPKPKKRKPGSTRKYSQSPKTGIPSVGVVDVDKPSTQELWQAAPPLGRPRAVETPDQLMKTASEYFEWCDNNPMYEVDYKTDGRKGLRKVYLPKKRPYTHSGLSVYMGLSVGYVRGLKRTKDADKFASVIQIIDDAIRTQKFDGAAAGLFNATIISRDLGLAEQSNIELNDKRADTAELFPFKHAKKTKS